MFRGASSVFASVVCVLGLAAPAVAQGESRPATRSLDYYVLFYLGNEELHKEVGLKAETVKKLIEHKEKAMSDISAARGDEARRQELQKANTKALGETLSAAELKRLREITLQQLIGGGLLTRTLGEVRELVEGLKLTDKQRDQINAGDKIEDVLTDAQKPKWKEMLGEPTKLALQPSFGQPGRQRPFQPTMPRWVAFVQSETAQKELELKKDQLERLAAMNKAWQEATRDYANWSREESATKVREANVALNKTLAEILTAAQVKRLRQIEMQQDLTDDGPLSLYTHARTVSELKLSGEQTAQIDKLLKERRTDLGQVFLSGKKHEQIAADVAAHKKKTEQMLRDVLSDEQRKGLADLTGPEFKGSLYPDGGGRGGLATSILALELTFVSAPELAKELELDADKAKALSELRTKYQTELRQGRRDEAEVAKLREKYSKQIDEILPAEKRKRMREIVLQQTQIQNSVYEGMRINEVEKELKVTDEQKQKLARGETMEKVLDAEQTKAWQAMLGKKFEGRLSTRPDGFRTPPPQMNIRTVYLQSQTVQADLRMTDEQKKTLTGLQDAWQEAVKDYRDWSADQRIEKIAALNKEFAPKIEKVLDSGQNKRLGQIMLQRGLRSFGGVRPGADPSTPVVVMATPSPFGGTTSASLDLVLRYEPAVKELELTEKQQGEIKELAEDASKTRRLLSTELLVAFQEGQNREELVKVQTEFNKGAEDRLKKVLSVEQKKKLGEMLGEPFIGPITTRPPRFGQGGFEP